MALITLVRQELEVSDEQTAAIVHAVVSVIDGLGQRGQRQVRRLIRRLLRMGVGEIAELETRVPRDSVFHRRHMLLEHRVFEAQESFENFDQFRYWLKIGAGFCQWVADPIRAGVVPVPHSIAYSALDQEGMQAFHEDAVTFLRSARAGAVLWPHVGPLARLEILEGVLESFGSFAQ